MSMEESISLEETNKIRISLGLKPLTDDKAPVLDSDQKAEQNYAKRREQEAQELEAKKVQDRIAKVRNKRELNAALKGTTLGDAEEDVDDTLKWIKRNKKKEKELAKKRQQELENRDKEFLAEYTERDLVGLKVSHDFDGLDDGEARILTLKDSRILDGDEDELQNVEMAEEEKTKKRLENKIKKRDYTGYDDDEFTEGNQGGMKRTILAKYDEDIEGTHQTEFRLASSSLSAKAERHEHKQQVAASLNKTLLSIDHLKNIEINDYVQEGEIGFKKPKTKKKRPGRRAPADVDLRGQDEMNVDDGPIIPRERDLDANFVDDDELQAALARSRKAKLHKAKKLSPEELLRKVNATGVKSEGGDQTVSAEDDGQGLTFDETSEFVQAVGNNPVQPKREPKEHTVPNTQHATVKSEKHTDVRMADGDVALDELEAGQVAVKDEEEDIDMEMLDQLEEAIKQTEAEEKAALEGGKEIGTASEETFTSGLAATLNILRQQGVLARASADQVEREQTQRQRDSWLAEYRQKAAKRELERLQARADKSKDQGQREYENRLREQQDAREQMEAFKNYKPVIRIENHDEFGRVMTIKEQWKALSHKFHGKGSGKMKTEKRLKKIAEEKKKEAMASGDTPLSMSKAFAARQEKTGQAFFVLSVGNRGAVPQAAEFLDTQPPLAKGKTEKAKKKKEGKNAEKAGESGFMTLPAPSLHLTSNTAPGTSASASPAPKAGFSRIGSTSGTDLASQSGTPSAERPKVAFGMGVKRKAVEEANDSPASKRR